MDDSRSPQVADLIARAKEGAGADRERLFEQCRDYLAIVARAQVETWLRAKVDASDLVQQTMMEAHEDFDRFHGQTEAEWLAWLRRILARNAVDFVRHYRGAQKRQIGKELPLARPGDSVAGAPEPAARDPSPSQWLDRQDRQLRVAAALAQLPPDYQEVIMLRNLQRLAFDEVAERMGRSRPAVQMLWSRAIKKLQQTAGNLREDDSMG